MYVLLLNAGSSSLKCTVMAAADCTVLADSLTDWAGAVTHYRYAGPDGKGRSEDVSWKGYAPAVQRVLYDLTHVEPVALSERSTLAAVGHRVVHGGQFTSSVRITLEIRSRIAALADLAPLHNPPSLATLAAAEAELPGVPQVAVFDTAFHATLPPEAGGGNARVPPRRRRLASEGSFLRRHRPVRANQSEARIGRQRQRDCGSIGTNGDQGRGK